VYDGEHRHLQSFAETGPKPNGSYEKVRGDLLKNPRGLNKNTLEMQLKTEQSRRCIT
jgi:hypothetical protein